MACAAATRGAVALMLRQLLLVVLLLVSIGAQLRKVTVSAGWCACGCDWDEVHYRVD